MKVGDVRWVEFPPRGGREQVGRRPAMIAQATGASSRLPTARWIPLTTQLDALRFPGTVLVEPSEANGLPRPSVALVFQLTVIDQRRIGAPLGKLSETVLTVIWAALDELTARTTPAPGV